MDKFNGKNDGCLGIIIGTLLGAAVNAYVLKLGLEGIFNIDVQYLHALLVILAIKGL